MKRFLTPLLFVALFCLTPSFASAAVAFDASAQSTSGLGAKSVTLTVVSAVNSYIIAYIVYNEAGGSITGAKVNGSAMTQIAISSAAGGVGTVIVFGFLGTSTGSNIVSDTISGNPGNQISTMSYTGVNQSVTPDNTAACDGTASGGVTCSITPNADNVWVVAGGGNSAGASTAGSNATARVTDTNTGTYDSNGTATTHGVSFSMTINWTGSLNYAFPFVSLSPPVAATPLKAIIGLIKAFWIW